MEMEVSDTYRELIESDSNDISICWKISQIFLYILSSTTGYGSAILSYLLWHNVFSEHCPLWAQIISPTTPRMMNEEIPVDDGTEVAAPDWRTKIIVTSQHPGRCNLHHFVSLCSCVFGIAWLFLFAMCGKGGYDTRIFAAPWRVVPPALIFQFMFSIVAMFTVHDMDYGYSKFAKRLQNVVLSMNVTELPGHNRQCDIVQNYLEIYGPSQYSVCQLYPILKILSFIMAWSWILGLFVLVLRVILINDFKLLTVKIQDVPQDQVQEYSSKRRITDSEDNE